MAPGYPIARRAASLGLCWLGAAWIAGAPAVAHASILTFDQVRAAGGDVIPTVSGFGVPQDYGDRVTDLTMDVAGGQFTYGELGEGFTPNIVVDYFGGTAVPNNPAVSLWQDGYGDLENVLFGNQFSGTLNVLLTADPGFLALLYGFDLAGWPNADYIIAAVRVLDGGTVLFSEHDVYVQGDFNGPRHTALAFGTPLSGFQLLIEIDYSNLAGTQQDNVGIDNIRFGQSPPPGTEPPPDGEPQPIPEPGTTLLLAGGLAAAAFRRRRR
jgi:hypothetical protein